VFAQDWRNIAHQKSNELQPLTWQFEICSKNFKKVKIRARQPKFIISSFNCQTPAVFL